MLTAMKLLIVPTACLIFASRVFACCAVAPAGSQVVNADQTVIILWDEASQTQHFIRRADFKTDAVDVGFIVPSPSRPQLDETGGEAFARLSKITAPPVVRGGGVPFGCSAAMPLERDFGSVRLIEEKRVAGFDATVLTARSGRDLVAWLKTHGYAYSPETAEWAVPYLGGDWHFTALKVAKDDRAERTVKADSLRISFKTARPLFPYREPESASAASQLDVKSRLLRIYFIADSRHRGEIDGGRAWTGKAVWSGDITSHREALLRDLGLPSTTGPARWWLTEFEDRWPYAKAAGDVYFPRDRNQRTLRRDRHASIIPHDAAFIAMFAVICLMPLRGRMAARN